MSQYATCLIWLLPALACVQVPENPLFHSVIAEGLNANGSNVRLPEPTLSESMNADEAKAALIKIAGDERSAQEMLRNFVAAPFILKTRDIKAAESTVRVIDLWFVVHARFDEFDPTEILREKSNQAVEAGNMRIETRVLKDQDLREAKINQIPALEGRQEWRTHTTARLLDRIEVDTTDRVVLTRSPRSIVFASRTDDAFNDDLRFPNRWRTLSKSGTSEVPGPTHPYQGSLGYTKITSIAGLTDTLLVETHLAFVEPNDWFQGNPVLRSKFGLIAQEQIRRLRREIEKKRNDPKTPKTL